MCDLERTIFYGEKISEASPAVTLPSAMLNYSLNQETGTFVLNWNDITNPSNPVLRDATTISNTIPDSDKVYQLTASFTPKTDGSNLQNIVSGKSGGTPVTNLNSTTSHNYAIHVVKGELDITKTVNQLYPAPAEVGAQQSFVFKIERRNNSADITPTETFYEVITPSAANSDSTQKITGLKKGYYKITEEADAWRYTQSGTPVDNDNTIKDSGVVYIGRKTTSGDENKQPYFGSQTGSTYADAYPATIKFTNTLTNYHWLGDTTVVVNNISK
jgi:hypothetical protein